MSATKKSMSLRTVRGRVFACDPRLVAQYRSMGRDTRVTIEFGRGQFLEVAESFAKQVELPLMKVGDPVVLGYKEIGSHKLFSVQSAAIDWGNRKTFEPSGKRVTITESGRIIRKEDVLELQPDGSRRVISHFAVELIDADGKPHTVTFRRAFTRSLVLANVGCCVDLTYSPNYAMDASVTVKKMRIDWDATIQAREYFKHWRERLIAARRRRESKEAKG